MLYDTASDTIYLYHPFQLAAAAREDRAEQPVLDGDADAGSFGVGKLIYPDGEDQPFLTYAPEHHYAVSSHFSSEATEISAAVTYADSRAQVAGGTTDGRDFPGQVIKTINGEDYILIGNAEQLRAIGSGDKVYTAVYQAIWNVGKAHWEVDTDDSGNPIMLYGGDADLLQSQNGKKNYSFGKNGIDNAPGALTGRCGVDQVSGTIDPNMDIDNSGATYSSTANYIIFRDIDLNHLNSNENEANWTPLTFSGTMTGAVAEREERLWDDAGNITAKQRPVISNVRIIQKDPLKVNEYMGIGFFSTISNEINLDNIGVSAGTVKVSNIVLKTVSVQTVTSETESSTSLVSALTSSLGWLVGGLLDLLVGALTFGTVKLTLRDTLSALLNARTLDPSRFASGAFAGRIEGDVLIENCTVSDAEVQNINDYTGGFVGYSNGVTKYDGLSDGLGITVDALSSILNVIPGLGLGDLITILLSNGLAVDQLIPTGYYNPVIRNCEVNGFQDNTTIGSIEKKYAGGFIGLQIGTRIEDCSLKHSGTLNIHASEYGGGFSGLARDAEIKGLLTDIGIELVRVTQPQSLLLNCHVDVQNMNISGGSYLGGVAGALANSYAVNDSMQSVLEIMASGQYVGGVAGNATVGWISNLGKDSATESSLLKQVTDLLAGLLSTNPDKAGMLLSLVGIQPSAIMGGSINADSSAQNSISLNGNNYVGGIVGNGDGVYITSSDEKYLDQLPMWKWYSDATVIYPETKQTVINGLAEVSSATDYSGGIAGFLGGASVGGLLNGTLGIGGFLGFTVDGINITGNTTGFAVSAEKHYSGGAAGLGIGGVIQNSTINSITNVTAESYAGGFIGAGGPGSFASAEGGISINLLGLNHLISVENLLDVIPGIKLELNSCTVSGDDASGLTVKATGNGEEQTNYIAGGFIGRSNSTDVSDCHTNRLHLVSASMQSGYAGGFVGISSSGDLADLGESIKGSDGQLVAIDSLLDAIGIMVPSYENCTVSYFDGSGESGAEADVAGGFAGDFQSGTASNESYQVNGESSWFSVYGIDYVKGSSYAGGFGGRIVSGALADSAKGISILGGSGLSINLNDLLRIVEAYVPYVRYAGVKSDGLTVTAENVKTDDLDSGSAGGFAGYTSGAQISHCDVTVLRNTDVFEPEDPEKTVIDEYYNDASSYAVSGGRYAGGYIGKMDIGSAASVGKSLGVLGSLISLENILSALKVVVTTVEHSDVTGQAGGYSVRAAGTDSNGSVGHAGGFAGVVYGGHIQDSDAHNFESIIGRISAGGYVGEMEPGDAARLLESGSILNGLININADIASLLQTFVPTIRNSSTDSVPCGGIVRAQASSSESVQRGMAGGYVGHNQGGQILGLDTSRWLGDETYSGPTGLCSAERIRSVFGSEYAGGFTGFMEAADTTSAGGLSILGGLISVDNILGALSIVYPIQNNTAVYGPLANLTVDVWNSWVEFVGTNGGFGLELAQSGKVNDQTELDSKLSSYIYGFNVRAGRTETGDVNLKNPGGAAGGYVGLMRSGTITSGMAYDVKEVSALVSAGGFAGRMETGGAAEIGGVNILGLELNVGKLIDLAEVFVPVINSSSVHGYSSGMTVKTFGMEEEQGYAGGYVGSAYGAQIQLSVEKGEDHTDDDAQSGGDAAELSVSADWPDSSRYPKPVNSCNVSGLRRVNGSMSVGGYVGIAASAASLLDVNTNASDGILQGILDQVISNAADLVEVLPATVTTIHKAKVSGTEEWGFVVDGAYSTGDQNAQTIQYAPYAGGFAGVAEASFIGDLPENANSFEGNGGQTVSSVTVLVSGLRQVDAGLYAGGFIGLGDVNGVASVGSDEETGILDKLLGGLADSVVSLDEITALGVLRTYVRNARVAGCEEGYRVEAHANPDGGDDGSGSTGTIEEKRYAGCAGGFAGAMLNGTIQNSTALRLANVRAANYTGGFIGHMGKSGLVDADRINVVDDLIGLNAGVVDLFGTQVEQCSVSGSEGGIIVEAKNGKEPIAGGFAGYADLGRLKNCSTGITRITGNASSASLTRASAESSSGLNRVSSDGIAGGFIGRTDMAYLVSLEADSPLVNAVLTVVNGLLKLLYVGDLQNLGVIKLNIPGFPLELNVLSEGNVLYVSLLGIKVSVALIKENQETGTDTAVITIGDSEIRLPCTEAGVTEEDIQKNVEINLIKANRTELSDCTVTGIDSGYDVFAGKADYETEASVNGMQGSAGGFIGYNHEGKISDSRMELCDTVQGAAKYTGPFTGSNDLKSVYDFNTIEGLEGNNNQYSIYRPYDAGLQQILLSNGNPIGTKAVEDNTTETTYNRYDILHITAFKDQGLQNDSVIYDSFHILEDAKETGSSTERDLCAYASDTKAVLMLDEQNPDHSGTEIPEPGEMADPCSDTADLTIQKIWKDWFNFGLTRPDEITLYIYQHQFVRQNGGTYAEAENSEGGYGECGKATLYQTVTLTDEDLESTWSSTWRKVLENAPVVRYQDTDSDGNPDTDDNGKKIIEAYYIYTVTEAAVNGYSTSYGENDNSHAEYPVSAGDYELTVTNTLSIPLPDTGGYTDMLFVIAGVGIVLIGMKKRKKKA